MTILNQFMISEVSLESDYKRIQSLFVKAPSEEISLEELTESIHQFTSWFMELIESEPPPQSIKAINFGLFENTDEGISLYVMGSNQFDTANDDWASSNDWWPQNRYAPISIFEQLKKRLYGTNTKLWIISQAIAIVIIKAFFVESYRKFKSATHFHELYITTGFDEGKLYFITKI